MGWMTIEQMIARDEARNAAMRKGCKSLLLLLILVLAAIAGFSWWLYFQVPG